MANLNFVSNYFSVKLKETRIKTIRKPKELIQNNYLSNLENINNSIRLLNLRKYENYDFSVPRAYQIAFEEYNKDPKNLLAAFVLASASLTIGKLDQSKELYEKVLANLEGIPQNLHNHLFLDYSKVLYLLGYYQEAYEYGVLKLEQFLYNTNDFSILLNAIKICFENNDYDAVYFFFSRMQELTISGDELIPAVPHLLFALYFLKESTGIVPSSIVIRQTLNFFTRKVKLKELSKENLNRVFELMESLLLFKKVKTNLTEKEKYGFSRIIAMADVFTSYKDKDIYIKKIIKGNKKDYLVDIVRYEKDLLFAQEKDCFAGGETVNEVVENLSKVLQFKEEHGTETKNFIRNLSLEDINNEILKEINEIYIGAEYEDESDWNNFATDLSFFVNKYATLAIKAIKYVIESPETNPDLVEQTLKWLGQISSKNTIEARVKLLIDKLSGESYELRHGAILGISSLRKTDIGELSIQIFSLIRDTLRNAIRHEEYLILRNSMIKTLEYVEKWEKYKHDLNIKVS
jgi:hypothetical protein